MSTFRICKIAGMLLVLLAGVARAECPAWTKLVEARKNADDTAAALNKIVIPADLSKTIDLEVAAILLEDPQMSMAEVFGRVFLRLPDADKPRIAPYLAARLARDTADLAYQVADKEYTTLVNQKDQALKAAQAAFEVEQKWLEAEKQAIQNMPRDNTYLDRVSQITRRLRAAYEKMRTDLNGFRDCFPDVRNFLDDKELRLQKIDLLDAEIARRQGRPVATQPTTLPTTQPANPSSDGDPDKQIIVAGEPPPPGPLGDLYICDGPVVSFKFGGPPAAGLQGKFTAVGEKGFTYEREVDGQKFSSSIKIIKPPPLQIRINQRVEVVMSASGDPKAPNDAAWEFNNVIAGQIPSDNGCSNISNFKSQGDSKTATQRAYFGAGTNPYIRMYGGEWDSRDGTRMEVIWKYRKKE